MCAVRIGGFHMCAVRKGAFICVRCVRFSNKLISTGPFTPAASGTCARRVT